MDGNLDKESYSPLPMGKSNWGEDSVFESFQNPGRFGISPFE
jgi:hypothetical protein